MAELTPITSPLIFGLLLDGLRHGIARMFLKTEKNIFWRHWKRFPKGCLLEYRDLYGKVFLSHIISIYTVQYHMYEFFHNLVLGNIMVLLYLAWNYFTSNTSYPDYHRLVREVENGNLYMIKHKGVCIGTVTFDEQQEAAFDEIEWKNKSDKFIVIHRIAVFPSWQKKGIGRMLIEFVENYAKENDYKSIRLDVASSSSHLIKLYESIGYALTGDILYPKVVTPRM